MLKIIKNNNNIAKDKAVSSFNFSYQKHNVRPIDKKKVKIVYNILDIL